MEKGTGMLLIAGACMLVLLIGLRKPPAKAETQNTETEDAA